MKVNRRLLMSHLLALGLLTITHLTLAAESEVVPGTAQTADGVDIAYEARGKGDTALVFIHGWCGDREFWKNQVEPFAKDFRVVTLDLAGHGQSGKNREKWNVTGFADDIEAVVKKLGLKRVILVGHSMGGPIALASAKRLPGVVVGVIGVDTLQDSERKFPEEELKAFLAAFEKDFKATWLMGMKGMLPEKADPKLVEWLAAKCDTADQKMAIAVMRDLGQLDEKVLLQEAKVPVRCINSAGGFMFHTPTAVETNKKYADYQAVLIDEVGHYPMLEKPDEFNAKLRDVLKELRGK